MYVLVSTLVATMMAIAMIFVRLRASKRPVSAKKIILPPLFMSTGAFMFLFPVFRVEWAQVLEAMSVGIVFSVLLIISSKFEIKEGDIYLIPSRAFVFILFGLLLLRIVLKLIVGQSISVGETGGMFFLLAFGMIVSWRVAMLYKFRKLEKQLYSYPTQ